MVKVPEHTKLICKEREYKIMKYVKPQTQFEEFVVSDVVTTSSPSEGSGSRDPIYLPKV